MPGCRLPILTEHDADGCLRNTEAHTHRRSHVKLIKQVTLNDHTCWILTFSGFDLNIGY